jgi:hypothetical protein
MTTIFSSWPLDGQPTETWDGISAGWTYPDDGVTITSSQGPS